MISASKTTFSHFNLKILRPKVTKNIKNLLKKSCEFPPRLLELIVTMTPFTLHCYMKVYGQCFDLTKIFAQKDDDHVIRGSGINVGKR